MRIKTKYLNELMNKVIGALLAFLHAMLQKPIEIRINFHCINIFKDDQKTLVNNLFSILPGK